MEPAWRLSLPSPWGDEPTAAGGPGCSLEPPTSAGTWGAAGVDAEDAESWTRAEFGDDAEAAAQALQAYTAACHGEELW